MVCKEVTDILCDYMDNTLEAKVKSELDEHFKDCPPCVAFFNTYKKSTHICQNVLNDVPIPDELTGRIKSFLLKKINWNNKS